MIYRPYSSKLDEKAVVRIWRECGWPDVRKNKKQREAFRKFIACGTADVAEHHGEAECLVTTHCGTMTMMEEEIPFRAVTGVTAGRPVRRQGSAGELTARALMRAAGDGDAVAGLGIFDQGFYDKLGFGSFPYIHTVTVDPLTLKVPRLTRPPIRLTPKDAPRMAANIAERQSHHGLVKIALDGFIAMNAVESEKGFGLGFEDDSGRLTHHFWAKPQGENGPYEIWWMVYRDYTGMLELLSLMKNLGDQVNAVILSEPWGIQLQDLIQRPFRTQELTEGSKYNTGTKAAAWQQLRILDLNKTLKPLKLPGGRIRFNLELTDPIASYLPSDAPWRGLGGSWTVSLTEDGSMVEEGNRANLPLMRTSVAGFTRLVFGVAAASGLAATGFLEAPDELLAEMDKGLRLPTPRMVQGF